MRIFFSAAFILIFVRISAQDNFLKDFAPTAPNAASLGKFGEIPVSNHTGVPNISIPIHTLTEGNLSVPVAVSYHSGGIRVEETPSWVGLGWALNAGGMISRSTQHTPDEGNQLNQVTGYYKSYGHPMDFDVIPGNCQDLTICAQGGYDTEPDLFSFSINGYTGKFFFDKTRTLHLIPSQDLKIEPYITEAGGTVTIKGFILIDPQGTRYHFGATDASMNLADYLESSSSINLADVTGTLGNELPSGWYLSKIESADRKDLITFNYVVEKYAFFTPGSKTTYVLANTCPSSDNTPIPPIKTSINGRRLSSINGVNGSIVFTGDPTPRQDLSLYGNTPYSTLPNNEAKSLKTIEIRDKSNNCLRKFDFNYSYITAPTGNLPSASIPADNIDKVRLVLNSITEAACNTSVNSKTHTFEYYDLNQLPRRCSFSVDHWGFNNGKSNTTLIPGYPYTKTGYNDPCYFIGGYCPTNTGVLADREASFPEMRHGTLKKITYPTGGSSTFDFEANTARVSQENCSEGIINVFNAVPSNCIDPASDFRTYNFTQFQIDNGYLKLEMTLNQGCTGGAIELEIFAGTNPWGTSVNWLFIQVPNGSNSVSQTFQLDNLTLSAGNNYTFLLTAIGGTATATVGYQSVSFVESNKTIGGLRIKKITTADGLTANNIVKNFEYNLFADATKTSGVLLYMPLYTTTITNWKGELATLINSDCEFNGTSTFMCQDLPFVAFTSIGLNPMHSGQGSHIGYTNVAVYETGNGKSKYSYELGSTSSFPLTSFPFAQPTYNPRFGQLMKEEHFRETGEKVLEKAYTYAYSSTVLTQGQDVVKTIIVPVGLNCYGGTYPMAHVIPFTKYSLVSGYSLLSGISEKTYNIGTSTYFEKNTTLTYTISNGHYQKTTEDITDSDGSIYRTKFKYAKDYACPTSGACDETNTGANAEGKAILAMRKRNMIALPVEQTAWLKRPSWVSFRLTKATYSQYDKVNTDYNNLQLKTIQQVRPLSPFSSFTESSLSSAGVFSKSSSYATEYNYVNSDAHGKLLSVWKQNDPSKTQYIWGHNQKLPIAKVTNAESTEIAYANFEEPNKYDAAGNGNWAILPTGSGGWNTTSGNFHAGLTAFNLTSSKTLRATGLPAGAYLVSFWHRDGTVAVNGANVSTATGTWKYAETTLTFAGGSNTVDVTGSGASQYIDELRLHPTDALMTTFSYDDRNQLLISLTDENSVSSHFDYDNFQRLLAIRDQDKNIVQTFEYNFQIQAAAINDVKTRKVMTGGQTTTSQVNALTGALVQRTFQYFDGIGRLIQSNDVAQSPTELDIVTHYQYDQYSREVKKFIPYTASATNPVGAYRTNAATAQITFTNTWGAGGYGYNETRFEASPLNRPLEQAAPGATWRIGNSRTTELLYRGNTTADAVRDFNNNTTFAANLLWVTEETDENDRKRWTFSDKLGRTVLVKQELNASETAQTYTIYDDFGRVSYVIPPETTKKMITSAVWDHTNATYASMVFKYTYNARGLLSQKTVPSGGTATNYYDRLDRLVMTVDPNGFKVFTRYDILSRPVVSGKYKGVAIPNSGNPLYETPNTTAPHYYTSTAFPADNNIDVYRVFYYDDYDIDNNGSLGAGETYTNPAESGYETAAFLRTRGKATASKVGVLLNNGNAPTTFLTTRTYYDKEYSVIQTNKQNHLGGADITSNVYDFANRVTKTRRDHTATPPGGTLKTFTIREEYVYDHAGRLRFTR
ncbi:MAG: RHS repeat protein, partial [Saprospiraceae bacterium]|nr:RHS repeat protein [Saprospiraceae bacterium]